jgi:diguanylate cyclase (GGDEF)-like protein/PAS domain S-box-containing protein
MALPPVTKAVTIIPPPMYLALLATAGLASILLAASAWRHRRYPGFVFFAAMEVGTAWWIACYLGEQLDPAHERLWFALKFPAIAAIAPSWLLFILHLLGERPRARLWGLAFVWPVLLFPVMLTNDSHRWFFTDIVRRGELVGLNGPLFTIHLALAYTYILIGAALLFRDWRRRGSVQSGLMFLGGLLPFIGNVVNELGKASPALAANLAYNPTLPGFAFSSLFIGWAALRYRLLDPRPVARDALFESMPDVVLVLNEHDLIVDANRAAAAMLGTTQRALLGRPWADVFAAGPWRDVVHGEQSSVEREWPGETGPRWLEVQRHILWDARGRSLGLLLVARDVTARKQFEEELRAASYHDRLTGLANRRYFDDEAARLQASREFPVAIFAFDLDGLKQVNDRDGHDAGDALLQAMAAFLTHFFRAGDRVVRQGGDEFIVLLPSTTADEAERIRARLPAALAQANAGRTPPLRFSTGVSVAADAADWAPALKRADDRLYEAKRDAGAVPA